jgi:hypothetical protein
MAKLVAIHQPNFFPWLGYFDKFARADVFVILDHVQFPKTKGNWGNRVQLLIGGQPRFVTMPIRRDYHGVRPFNEMLTSSDTPWRDDLIKTVRTNYGRAEHFARTFAIVEPLIRNSTDNLADYNLNAIRTLGENLNLDCGKLALSSQLSFTSQATDLLIDIVHAVGGDAYLSGNGASGYQEPEKYAPAGIELTYQPFQHPVYRQGRAATFTPGLSCLDAIFHCGFETVASWLQAAASGRRDAA